MGRAQDYLKKMKESGGIGRAQQYLHSGAYEREKQKRATELQIHVSAPATVSPNTAVTPATYTYDQVAKGLESSIGAVETRASGIDSMLKGFGATADNITDTLASKYGGRRQTDGSLLFGDQASLDAYNLDFGKVTSTYGAYDTAWKDYQKWSDLYKNFDYDAESKRIDAELKKAEQELGKANVYAKYEPTKANREKASAAQANVKQLRDEKKQLSQAVQTKAALDEKARVEGLKPDEVKKVIAEIDRKITAAEKKKATLTAGLDLDGAAAQQAEIDRLRAQKKENERDINRHEMSKDKAKWDDYYAKLPALEDFDKFVKAGAAKAGQTTGAYNDLPVNVAHFYLENDDPLYKGMTKTEVDTYDYLLAKFGSQPAQQYLDHTHEELNRRLGTVQAKELQQIKNPFAKAAGYGAYAFKAGVDSALQGTAQFLTNERKVTSPTQFGSQELVSDLEGGAKLLYSAVNTVGNMVPSILVGTIAGGPVGSVAMGISAAGNAYNQLMAEGYGVGEARAVSLLVGASEATLENVLGGIKGLGGGRLSQALSRVADLEGVYNTVGGKLLMNIGSEVTEEEVQLFIEPLIKSLILEVPYDAPNFSEIAETALTTILSTGMLEGAPAAVDATASKVKQTVDRLVGKYQEKKAPAPTKTAAGAGEVKIPVIPTKAIMAVKNDPKMLAEMGIETEGRTDRAIMDDVRAVLTLNEMVRQAVTQATEKVKAVDEAQSVPYNESVETETATVLNRGTTLYLEKSKTGKRQGITLQAAERNAALVQDLIDGKDVKPGDLQKLCLHDPVFREIFTELTGVQFPAGKDVNVYKQIAMTAHEVAQQKQAELEQVQSVAPEAVELEAEAAESTQTVVPETPVEAGRAFVGKNSGMPINETQAQLLGSLSTEALQNAGDVAGRVPMTFNHIGLGGDHDAQQRWIDAGLAYLDQDADGNTVALINDVFLLDERARRHAIEAQKTETPTAVSAGRDSETLTTRSGPVTRAQFREEMRGFEKYAHLSDAELDQRFDMMRRASEEDGVVFDLSDPTLEEMQNTSWAEQIENTDTLPADTALYMAETPISLRDVGLGDLPMCMTVDHVKDAMSPEGQNNGRHQHGISDDVMKRLPDLIANPVMILDSVTKPGEIMVVTAEVDAGKNPIVVTIKPNGRARVGGVNGPANFITSVYGREHFASRPNEKVPNNLLYLVTGGAGFRGVMYWNSQLTQQLMEDTGMWLPQAFKRIPADQVLKKHDRYNPGRIPERLFEVEEENTDARDNQAAHRGNGQRTGAVADGLGTGRNADDSAGGRDGGVRQDQTPGGVSGDDSGRAVQTVSRDGGTDRRGSGDGSLGRGTVEQRKPEVPSVSGRELGETVQADEAGEQVNMTESAVPQFNSWGEALSALQEGIEGILGPDMLAPGEDFYVGYRENGKWKTVATYPRTAEGLAQLNAELGDLIADRKAARGEAVDYGKAKVKSREKLHSELNELKPDLTYTKVELTMPDTGEKFTVHAADLKDASSKVRRIVRFAQKLGYPMYVVPKGEIINASGTAANGVSVLNGFALVRDSDIEEGRTAEHEEMHLRTFVDYELHFQLLDAVQQAGLTKEFNKLYKEAKKIWGKKYKNKNSRTFQFRIEGEVFAEAMANNSEKLGPEIKAISPVVQEVVKRWDAEFNTQFKSKPKGWTPKSYKPEEFDLERAYSGQGDEFDPGIEDDSTAIYGQPMFALESPVEEKKNLIAVHNLTISNLRKAATTGALLAPSTAVVKRSQSHQDFGEITFLMHKDAIDPDADPRNLLYGDDAFSPITDDAGEVVEQRYDHQTVLEIAGDLAASAKDCLLDAGLTEPEADRLVRDGRWILANKPSVMGEISFQLIPDLVKTSLRDPVVRYAFLAEFGIKVPKRELAKGRWLSSAEFYQYLPGETASQFEQWVTDFVTAAALGEPVNRFGNNEAVVAEMYRNSKARNVSALASPEYKSISEVKRNAHKLSDKAFGGTMDVSADFMEHLYYILGELNFDPAVDSIGAPIKGITPDKVVIANDVYDRRIRTLREIEQAFANQGEPITREQAKKLRSLFREADQRKVNYFEAKPARPVAFSEVAAAIIPDNTPDDLIQYLRDQGVKDIRTYKAGDSESRKKAVNSVVRSKDAVERGILFNVDDPARQKFVEDFDAVWGEGSAEEMIAAVHEAFFRAQDEAKAEPVTASAVGSIAQQDEELDGWVIYGSQPENPSVGAADSGFDPYSHLLNEYGAIEQTGKNNHRIADVPKSTNGVDRVSKTTTTVMGAKATPEKRLTDIASAVIDGKLSHHIKTDAIAVNRARHRIREDGFDAALAEWRSAVDGGKTNKDLVAMGATLLNNAGNSGMDGEGYVALLVDYSDLLTRAGQALQAANLFKKMTPEGRLFALSRTLNRMNRNITPRDNVPVDEWMKKVGEGLAEKLVKKATGKVKKAEAKTVCQTILADLHRFALESLSEVERETGVKRTEMDRILDLFRNYDQYQTAWEEAKQAVLEKYGKRPEILEFLNDWGNAELDYVRRLTDELTGMAEVTIDPELAEQFLSAETDEAREAVMESILQNIADQIPATKMDKFTALRYTSMLANLRTMLKNTGGNVMMQPVRLLKTTYASLAEALLEKAGVSIDRSTSVHRDSETLDVAKAEFDGVREIIAKGGRYGDESSNLPAEIRKRQRIFKTAWLEGLRKGTTWMMDNEFFGDAAFSYYTFRDALSRYIAANHTTWSQASEELKTKALEKAIKEAAEATYRDSNAVSDTLAELRFRDPNNWLKGGLNVIGEGVLPFRRTPANVGVRIWEYSPFGLLTTAFKSAEGKFFDKAREKLRVQKIEGSDIINELSKNLTGVSLVALGMGLKALGVLVAGAPDDEKEKELWEMQGHQEYALEIGNTSYTIDWAAPASVALFTGAELWEAFQEKGVSMRDALGIFSSVFDPMLEMSMLQGIDDALSNAQSYGDDSALIRFVGNALWNYVTQPIPTLLGQIERSTSNKRMTTYVDKNADMPDAVQRALGKASAKLPGWDYGQVQYVDAWGRTQENANTATLNVIEQFVSPGYASTIKETAMEKELVRLYEATGDTGVLISKAPKYFTVNKARKDLTGAEYLSYAKTRGQAAFKLVTEITENKVYKSMDDATRAKAVASAYDFANQTAKELVTNGAAAPDKWVSEARSNALELGVPVSTYIAAKTLTSGATGFKDKKGDTVDDSKSLQKMQTLYAIPGLSDEQRKKLAEDLGVGKDIRRLSQGIVESRLKRMQEKYG